MPLASRGGLTLDYAEQGAGEPVFLLPSCVSGNRQWRSLADALSDRYRTLAVNLFGYGETTAWPENSSQSLYAQASLLLLPD
jgi:pimeloyl-ACP methyl ester carboxylesterase